MNKCQRRKHAAKFWSTELSTSYHNRWALRLYFTKRDIQKIIESPKSKFTALFPKVITYEGSEFKFL